MSKHDFPRLFFDRTVADHENAVRIDVTRCDEHDQEVQINLRTLDGIGPRSHCFLTLAAAEQLAHTLLEAVNATVWVDPHQAMAYGTGLG